MHTLKAYMSMIDPKMLNQLSGKTGEFIRALKSKKYINEAAFINEIRGKDKPQSYYDSLKHRSIKMMQALAIVSTSHASNEVKKKLDICRKNFVIGQKFIGKGERIEGLRLIKQAYHIAIEYNYTLLSSELASILFHNHVSYNRNSKLADMYAMQVDRFANDYRLEKKVEYYLYKAISITSWTRQTEFLKKAVEQVELLECESLRFKTYKGVVKALFGFNTGNYELVIRTCTQTLRFFEEKKGVLTSYYFSFNNNLAIAQMATKQHKLANESFEKANEYVTHNSVNEAVVSLYQTTNYLHAGDYQAAYDLYRQNRKCRFEDVKQQFAIIEAYLCFLSCMGYLQLDHPFRIGKYLNETFKAQADKQGTNIAILIAELLVYLARDKGKFIDRVEAINSYSYRHLKGEDTKRAKRFIKILCLMPRANFNHIALKRLASKQIQYLKGNPICMGDNVSIEIIPFEVLLDMILVKLERKVA